MLDKSKRLKSRRIFLQSAIAGAGDGAVIHQFSDTWLLGRHEPDVRARGTITRRN